MPLIIIDKILNYKKNKKISINKFFIFFKKYLLICLSFVYLAISPKYLKFIPLE